MGLQLSDIAPLTQNQQKVFESYYQNRHLFLHGVPGSGKTFLGMYLALDDLINKKCDQHKLMIVRSLVSSREIGFLPGTQKEKGAPYEMPYQAICNELFNRGDSYEILKRHGMLEFLSTSFNRGITINNAIVLVDEVQNMSAQELHTIITRVGRDCRIIFCGDIRQNDLNHKREFSGLSDFMKIIKTMNMFDFIEFEVADIVRDNLVKQYIISRLKLEDSGAIQSILKI